MSALAASAYLETYREKLSAFQEIEDFMGEVAELVAHVADALSHYPDEIDLSPGAPSSLNCLSLQEQDWPSFARLQSLLRMRRERRDALAAAWNRLSERERAQAEPLPPSGVADPSLAVL
jgi:hypothetical protein